MLEEMSECVGEITIKEGNVKILVFLNLPFSEENIYKCLLKCIKRLDHSFRIIKPALTFNIFLSNSNENI